MQYLQAMSLRDKIFRFGIYGQKISSLSENELKEAKSQEWSEFLSPNDLKSFKKHFTLAPYETFKDKCNIPKDSFIRMNLHAWRAYLLGPNFITKNKFYFLLADYLLMNPNFVPLSELRSMFGIDPKTLHYICKKFKEKNIIVEQKKTKDSEIKLNKIVDMTIAGETHSDVENRSDFCLENLKNFIYFNNVSFIDQLKYHVDQANNGIGSKELTQICGMKPKIALKNMYRLCDLYPESYKLISSVDQKHTAFKVFNIENLNKRNQRKLESMAASKSNEQDLLLSSKDRQEALKILAQKYKFFPLSKEIISEISEMTGYPYEIDRKNLIKNAKETNLKVFKLDKTLKYKYIIALPEYEEFDIHEHFNKYESKPSNEEFFKALKKHMIQNERLTIQDNGYCEVFDMTRSILYKFLCSFNMEKIHFDYQVIGKMPVSLFYQMTKIKKFLFKAKCAYEAYQNILAKMKVDLQTTFKDQLLELDVRSFYVDEPEPKRLSQGIIEIMNILDKSDLKGYISCLSEETQEYMREISKPLKFIKKLKGLQRKNLIEFNVDDTNRIFIEIHQDPKYLESRSMNYQPKDACYNTRALFVNLMRNSNLETFFEDSENVIIHNFSQADQKLLRESLKGFSKESDLAQNQKDSNLSVDSIKIYLDIKKMLIFQIPISFDVLSAYEHSDIIDVLRYMSKKEIISGFRSSSSLQNIVINSKFKSYVSERTMEELPSDSEYFKEIFPKIVNIISSAGSIDFDQILFKSKFLEDFELHMFFKCFPDEFNIKNVDGFLFISMADVQDPFE